MKGERFKNYFLHFFCFMMLSCAGIQNNTSKGNSAPPNLIVIMVDDMGYADVGFNGGDRIPTPNIDRIANEGVRFSNGYVSYAVCGPSRAGFITGRYQGRFGFSRNPLFAPNDPNMGLPVEEETIAEALKQANYKSVVLGKWHLGAHPSQRPLKQGFDDFFGFLTGGHRYMPEEWTLEDEYEVSAQFEAYKTKLLRNNERIVEKEYLTDALSREAVSYIEKYKEDPFFIYLAYNAPHAPLQATEKYLKRFNHIENKKSKTYCAMVSAVDDGVGRLLNKLDALELTENTIVVFLSDNGGLLKISADNGPLRGKKGDLYEGGIRVPFTMRWPKKIQKGSTYEQPIISLDIFATIVGQNNGTVKTKNKLDGVDLIPYLNGNEKGRPHDALFWRKFDAKDIAVMKGSMKSIKFSDGDAIVYDLEKDIGERHDISSAHGENVNLDDHRVWSVQLKDPIFSGLKYDSIYNLKNPDRFTRPK